MHSPHLYRRQTLTVRALGALLVILALGVFAPAGAQETPVRVPRDHFVAKFRDIEVSDFLKTMAQITQRNILIPDNIKGKVTIVSYKPIPVSRALDFMKQVLEVKGFAIIEERNLLKVVQTKEAADVSEPQPFDPDKYDSGVVSRVVRVPGGKVQELVNILRPLVGKDTVISSYAAANSLILTGHARNVRRALQILKSLGVDEEAPVPDTADLESTSTVHIYRARNIKAESLAQVLVRLDNPQVQPTRRADAKGAKGAPAPAATPTPSGPAQKIKAVAHKESNSLIVTAGPDEWREIQSIIQRLDQIRTQILLEVLIVEVTSSRLNDFGIDWRYQGKSGTAPHTQFNTGRALEGGLVSDQGRITGNNTLAGFSLGFLQRGGELLAIFNANVKNQNFNVLSAPQILTLDNQEAEINVGQDVPVRTQERSSGGGTSESTVNSFDYRPAGIKLKFTPNVNPEGLIGVDLFQEVTNIEGGATAGQNPTFNKRNIKTFVTVKNKQTIVVGGLVSRQKLHTVTKIPLLGDIPLLGFLFRRTTYDTRKTNLMVFITPHILDNPNEARRISTYKRSEQIEAERVRSNELKLWPERQAPHLREKMMERTEKGP